MDGERKTVYHACARGRGRRERGGVLDFRANAKR